MYSVKASSTKYKFINWILFSDVLVNNLFYFRDIIYLDNVS